METLEAIRIDLADYEYAGEGANGVSYNHRHDPDVMLKLYRQGLVQQPLDEMTIARKVYEAGIPTPEPGDFVTDGTRYGVRFRRIRDKVSYARAVGDHPENLVRYAEEFAQMCRQLHATHVDTTAFECVKDKYSRQLVENPFFTPAEKDRLLRFILDAPDTDTAIHGDLQYGNALFVGDERYFIDWAISATAIRCSISAWCMPRRTSASRISSGKPSTWNLLRLSVSGRPLRLSISGRTVRSGTSRPKCGPMPA